MVVSYIWGLEDTQEHQDMEDKIEKELAYIDKAKKRGGGRGWRSVSLGGGGLGGCIASLTFW